ncbi:MAG TPA: M13-type metalloendopeptidase, partial [Vicinamibacteria bacterium]
MKTWLTTIWVGLLLVPEIAAPAERVSGIDTEGLSSAVRPQDDFNAYVNGIWMRDTEIPADKQTWGTFAILNEESEKSQRAIVEELSQSSSKSAGTDEQRVGDFYRSFMNTERLEELGARPADEDLKRVLAAASVSDLFRLSAANRIAGVDSPLSLQVFPDLGDSTRYVVYFSQSGLTLPDRDYYLKEGEKYETLRTALPGYAAKLFQLAGMEDAEGRGRAVLEVEKRLAEPQWAAEETRNVQKIYNLYKRSDLRSASDRLDWDAYLESSGIPDVGQLVITEPSYVTALGNLLQEIPLGDWKSYFAFRLLDAAAPYLSDAFVQARFDFVGRLVSGLEEEPPRWQRGVRNVNALMGEAVGKLYVERHFPPEAKARMEELVLNLIETYREAIQDLPWMTAETKERAQEKRKKFTYKIGYPERFRDYSRLVIDRDDLMGNVKRANEFEYQRNLDKLGRPIDRSEWQMTPQTVNAYYDPTKNQIVFPAAILQPPFFNMAAD